jgi:hypothetical protein
MFLRYQEMHKGGLQSMMRAAITATVFMRPTAISGSARLALPGHEAKQPEAEDHMQSMQVLKFNSHGLTKKCGINCGQTQEVALCVILPPWPPVQKTKNHCA